MSASLNFTDHALDADRVDFTWWLEQQPAAVPQPQRLQFLLVELHCCHGCNLCALLDFQLHAFHCQSVDQLTVAFLDFD